MSDNKNLKPGWKIRRFDQIARQITERVDPTPEDSELYVGLEHMDPESLRIRRWGSQTDLIGTKFRMRKGDVLFARRNAYLKRVAIAPHDGLFSAHGMVLRPIRDAVIPDFLPFFMQSDVFMDRAVEISVGSLSPTINWKSMAGQEFALPPAEEQLRITEVLKGIDGLTESLVGAKEATERLKFSLTEDAFPVSEVRSFFGDPAAYGGRSLVRLGELASLQVGFPFKSAEYSSAGDRLLRGSNVGVNRLIWDRDITCYWPTKRRFEVREYVLNAGDIVIAMDRPFIGEGFKIARVTEADLPALLLQRVGRFRLTERITSEYLWAFLHSESFKWQLQRMQKGTDLPHISKFDIEGTLIPALAIDNQSAIADSFAAVAAAEASLEHRVNTNLKQKKVTLHALIDRGARHV